MKRCAFTRCRTRGNVIDLAVEPRGVFHRLVLLHVSLLAAAVFVLPVHAQPVEWAQSAGGQNRDRTQGIAVDAGGNSYLLALVDSGAFGHIIVPDPGSYVAKYDSDGNIIWARPVSGFPRGIAVDDGGNIYLTGSFKGTTAFGSIELTAIEGSDVFVVKYNSAGNAVWAKRAGGPDPAGRRQEGRSIAVDGSGNTYVTGLFGGTVGFVGTSGTTTLTSAGSFDIFVAKLDSSGNAVWAKSAGGTESEQGLGIAVDPLGNSFVTGAFDGVTNFDGIPVTSANSNVFVAKYNSGGTVLWVKSADGANFARGNGVAVDDSGSAYVTGTFSGTATFGTTPLTSNPSFASAFLAKYDSGGGVVWARSGDGDVFAESIAVDGVGNSYVAGSFESTEATFGSITITNVSGPIVGEVSDVFVVNYDSAGNVVWAKSSGGPQSDYGSGVALDGLGNCYVAGVFSDYLFDDCFSLPGSTATFGTHTLTSEGCQEVFVAKYGLPHACCPYFGGSCFEVGTGSACPDGTDATFLPLASCSANLCGSTTETCVASTGCTVETPDNGVSVTFPPGCLSSDTTITVDPGTLPNRMFIGGGPVSVISSYQFEPDTAEFCSEAELCISFDRIAEGVNAADCWTLRIVHQDDSGFHSHIPTSCECPTTSSIGTCCIHPEHFSEFGLVIAEEDAVPTVSEWGLVVMTLLLVVGGAIYFGRRRATA